MTTHEKTSIILDEMCDNNLISRANNNIDIKISYKLFVILHSRFNRYKEIHTDINARLITETIVSTLINNFHIIDREALFEYSMIIDSMFDNKETNIKEMLGI